MAYRWVDHTAELELHIDARHRGRRLRGRAAGARASCCATATAARSASRSTWTLGASDRATLLARWLDELVFLAETEDLVPDARRPARPDADGLGRPCARTAAGRATSSRA